MNKPKCGCRKCIAMKIYKTKNHPWFDQAFWESINGGKTDVHPTLKYRLARLKIYEETGNKLYKR